MNRIDRLVYSDHMNDSIRVGCDCGCGGDNIDFEAAEETFYWDLAEFVRELNEAARVLGVEVSRPEPNPG